MCSLRNSTTLVPTVCVFELVSQTVTYLQFFRFSYLFSHFFYSETYVCQLLDALSALLQLEKKSLVGQEVVFLNLKDCDFLFNPQLYLNSSRPPEKLFRHLNSKEVLNRTMQIVAVIATYAKSDLIVSYLTEKMRQGTV